MTKPRTPKLPHCSGKARKPRPAPFDLAKARRKVKKQDKEAWGFVEYSRALNWVLREVLK